MANTAIEIVTGRERHRRWNVEEKLRMVAATAYAACSATDATRDDGRVAVAPVVGKLLSLGIPPV